MTVLNYKFLVFCLLNVILTSQAQEGRPCTTPAGAYGTCVNIRQCNMIITLLLEQGTTPEVSNYLRRSACGWIGRDPLVCCANSPGSTERPQTPTPNSGGRISPITVEPVTQRPVTQPPITFRPITREPEPPTERRTIDPLDRRTNSENNPNILRPPFCGKSNAQTSRIVNGAPAKPGEYPWIVALGYRNNKNPSQPKWLCGGSMITDRHILTAGHCVHNRPDLYLARLGELDLYSDDDNSQPSTHSLINAKVHENYSPSAYTNDIAILTLAESHNNPTVNPICLPVDEPERGKNYTLRRLTVAGWGALYFNGPSSPTLQAVNLPVVSNEACSRAFASIKALTIDQRVLCAGYLQGGKDACQGDSGGPLMEGKVEGKNSTFYQIGLVSYGFRCAEQGYPGVYTRITNFIDWIDRQLV